MKNSKIMLSAFAACAIFSVGLADTGINWQRSGSWQKCEGDSCNPRNYNAGVYSTSGNANDAVVVIDKNHNSRIYGGYTTNRSSDANGNSITIQNSAKITADMIGAGYTLPGRNANYNETIIKDRAEVNAVIYGAYGSAGASYNSVTITGEGTKVTKAIYGANSDGLTANNAVIVTDLAQVTGPIDGGWSDSDEANENTVTISGEAKATGGIIGGNGQKGANDNKVFIEDEGTEATGNITGGKSNQGGANRNEVIIYGGTSANITGGSGKTSADDNKIIITGNSSGEVKGGSSSEGTANNNTVNIGGNSEKAVTGGTGKTNADNNKVTIGGNSNAVTGGKGNDSAVNNEIIVLGSANGDLIGGESSSGKTDKNSVSVYGDVTGDIFGGYNGTSATGNDNTVNLLGDISKIAGNLKVGSQAGSGNTLNIKAKNPVEITGDVGGAQNINLDVGGLKKNDSVLKVGSIDVDGSTINANLSIKGGDENFKTGDSIKLIDGSVTGTAKSANIKATQGGALDVIFDVDPSHLNKELKGQVVVKKEIKALSEGVVSAAAVLSAENDNISQKGVANAMAATTTTLGAGSVAVASFGSMNAGANTIKTGSHVKTDGINAMFGLAVGKEFDNGKLTIGPFIEFGTSDYETFNDTDSGEIKGDGENKFIGAGLLARYDFGSIFESRAYVEGSARAGRNRNKYTNKHITDGFGNYVDYNLNSNYFGAHFGAGYELKLDAHSFDFYAKYFYTRLGGKSVEVLGMPYDFKAVNSHRLQAGIKYELEIKGLNDTLLLPYAGLGYEYEFDGKSKAYVAGYEIKSPTLKGGSGYGDLGLSFANANKKGFRLDIGARGYFGKRRGLSGVANAKYEF